MNRGIIGLFYLGVKGKLPEIRGQEIRALRSEGRRLMTADGIKKKRGKNRDRKSEIRGLKTRIEH